MNCYVKIKSMIRARKITVKEAEEKGFILPKFQFSKSKVERWISEKSTPNEGQADG